MALKMAFAGWWGGDPEKVEEARADRVLEAIEYAGFASEYDRTMYELNKGGEDE